MSPSKDSVLTTHSVPGYVQAVLRPGQRDPKGSRDGREPISTSSPLLAPQPRRDSLADFLIQHQGFVGRGTPTPPSEPSATSPSLSGIDDDHPSHSLGSPPTSAGDLPGKESGKENEGPDGRLNGILRAGRGGNTEAVGETIRRAHDLGAQFLSAQVSQACQKIRAAPFGAGLSTGSSPLTSNLLGSSKHFGAGFDVSLGDSSIQHQCPAPAVAPANAFDPAVAQQKSVYHAVPTKSTRVALSPAAAFQLYWIHLEKSNSRAIDLYALPLELNSPNPTAVPSLPSSFGRSSRRSSRAAGNSDHQRDRRASGATDRSQYSQGYASYFSYGSCGSLSANGRTQIHAAVLRNPSGCGQKDVPKLGHGESSFGQPMQTIIGGFDNTNPAPKPAGKRRGLPSGLMMTPIEPRQEPRPVVRQPSGHRHRGAAKVPYTDPSFSSFRHAPPRQNSAGSQVSRARSKGHSSASHHSETQDVPRRPSAGHSATSHSHSAQLGSRRPSAATTSSLHPCPSASAMRRPSASGSNFSRPSVGAGSARRPSAGAPFAQHHSAVAPSASRRPSASTAPENSGSRFDNVYEATNGRSRSGFRPSAYSAPRRRSSTTAPAPDKEKPVYTRAYLKRFTRYPLPKAPIPADFQLPTHGFPRFCEGRKSDGQNCWNFCLKWSPREDALLRCLYCEQFIPREEEEDAYAAYAAAVAAAAKDNRDWETSTRGW